MLGAVDECLFPDDGLNGGHHDLRLGVLDEAAEPGELAAVILETRGGESVGVGEGFLEILDGGEHAFLDGNGRDEDDELREFVFLVEGVCRAEINERLAGAGLHFDADVGVRGELGVFFVDAVFGDDFALVGFDLFRRQVASVRLNAEEIGVVEVVRGLPVKDFDDRRNGAALVIQVFEFDLHSDGLFLRESGVTSSPA